MPRPWRFTVFPYTTLFRSVGAGRLHAREGRGEAPSARRRQLSQFFRQAPYPRSEEHTSELQSQSNLVCRHLLEKKNIDTALIHSAAEHTGTFPWQNTDKAI